ncbi:MAG: thioredoxin domain-containing protein [Pseudomonadota bacterium]|nr:thioredoxin domain-containing protein [Pseudomonadota bacterium]
MNKLATEKSLYLKQHADNPVNWFPWSDEAFDMAKKNDMPIMLSVGYSACHWCHVMAQESFEDMETAKLLNKYFINIKVDKEERPDLDKVYQLSQAIITGRTGGWPLTIFMSPNKIPFFAGTYFPNEQKYGLPSFKEILERVNDFYRKQKNDIEEQNIKISKIFQDLNRKTNDRETIDQTFINKIQSDLISNIDKIHGGFGSAPKFPQTYNLSFILNCINKSDKENLENISNTVERMCLGGIFDQLEGGFFRYSVDDVWMIPHFEKMLYDNGPLIELLCKIYRMTSNPIFLKRLKQTSNWLINKMQDEVGGFYSSIDADSEHVEGKYYVWEREELESILDNEEFKIVEKSYFVNNKPNFEGKYHFHITKESKKDFFENETKIDVINGKLNKIRNKRVAPNIDKKFLVSWNALAIIGLINAYKLTGETSFFKSANECFHFIKKNLWKNRKLFACFNEGPCFEGYLDDYAFLLKATLELLKAEWNTENFYFAQELADVIIKDFQDYENGGFYFTSKNHEELIYRPQTFTDESLPSGNSLAIDSLIELGFLEGKNEYIDVAEKAILSASDSLRRSGPSHASLLIATMNIVVPKRIIIIRCPKAKIEDYKKTIFLLKKDHSNCFFINNEESDMPKELSSKKSIDSFTAYICEGFKCLTPINDFQILLKELS